MTLGKDDHEAAVELTNKIVEGLDEVDLQVALMVVCNLAGQLVASLCEGKPSAIQELGDNVAENVKAAAIKKLFHDADEKRKQ